MGFKARPVRSNILKPLPRFGVHVGDWKYIVGGLAVFFVLPFILNLWVWVFPLGALTGPGAALTLFAFFNWVHKGKRALWFQHQFRAVPRKMEPLPSVAPRRLFGRELAEVTWS